MVSLCGVNWNNKGCASTPSARYGNTVDSPLELIPFLVHQVGSQKKIHTINHNPSAIGCKIHSRY